MEIEFAGTNEYGFYDGSASRYTTFEGTEDEAREYWDKHCVRGIINAEIDGKWVNIVRKQG